MPVFSRSPIHIGDVCVIIVLSLLLIQLYTLMRISVFSIGLIGHCCSVFLFTVVLILVILCDEFDKHGQPWWWPSWAINSSSSIKAIFSFTRSPYKVEVCASVMSLLKSSYPSSLQQSFLSNNNEDGPLMKLPVYSYDGIGHFRCGLVPLIYCLKLWFSSTPPSPYEIDVFVPVLSFISLYRFYYLQQSFLLNSNENGPFMKLPVLSSILCCLLIYNILHYISDIYFNQVKPWWRPSWAINSSSVYQIETFLRNEQMESTHFTLQEPRKTQTLLLNQRISRISGRTEIQSSVSNKVETGNDEEDQISSEGLKETFDSCSPRSFTLAELALATNYFHQDRILGAGGFGAVYKAVLPDGQTAAVKRVSSTSKQGIKEYIAEVKIVSRSKHRHLVQLIGWCHEKKGEFLLVYELLENKSLDKHLFDPKMASLPWKVRYKIAQGLAKALSYLHEECGEHSVLHRDIKSSNVLLDSNFEPKLSDFGLARLVDNDKSLELSEVAGTKGYIAPECFAEKKARSKSDVYSYGVLALELVAGRRSVDYHVAEDQQVLVEWVQNLYKARRVMKAVDLRLGGDYDKLQVKGLLIVGLWCVLHDFRKRPSMREIVRILNNTHDPLMGLKGKIPNLVPDPVSHDFDSIRPRTGRRFGCF